MSFRSEFEQARRTIEENSDLFPKRGRYPLLAERDVVIIWGTYRGWSRGVMARILRQGVPAVRERQLYLMRNPRELFNVPVMTRKVRGSEHYYVCEFCDNHILDELKAREHVASHITTEEVIYTVGVDNLFSLD